MVGASFFVLNSNSAGIVGILITSVFGYLGILRSTRRVHNEVKSPNGTTTGVTVELILEEQKRVKKELRRTRNRLADHIQNVSELDTWVRAKMLEDGCG